MQGEHGDYGDTGAPGKPGIDVRCSYFILKQMFIYFKIQQLHIYLEDF